MHLDDFGVAYDKWVAAGIELVGLVRDEPYGTLQVFRDPFGNLWDLLSD